MAGLNALEDFVLPTLDVDLPGGKSFSVRGISLQDATLLITRHGALMEGFFAKYSGESDSDPLSIGLDLLGKAPELVAEIISLAADAPHLKDKIAILPLTVQQDALQKIAAVTFDSSGGPKKFFEAVIRLVQGTTNLLTDLGR